MLCKGFAPTTGGIETYSSQVAIGYSELGYEVDVVTQIRSLKSGKFEPNESVSVYNVGGGGQAIVLARVVLFLLRNCLGTRRRYRIVHATTWRMSLPVILMGCASPLVVTIHGNEFIRETFVKKLLMGFLLSKADKVVSVSRHSRDLFYERHPWLADIPIEVVYNGTRFGKTRGSALCTGTGVLMVCRHEVRKNIITALRAFRQLRDLHKVEFDVTVVGGGTQTANLKAYAKRSSMEFVRFVGRVANEELQRFYEANSIFVHPQLQSEEDVEGFGLTVAEAMAMGLVPIAGNNAALPELISNSEDGFLVDPVDIDEISEKLLFLVSNAQARRRMQRCAMATAHARFDWESHARSVLTLM